MILHIRHKQQAHAQRVHQHITTALDVEETRIYRKFNKTILTRNLVPTNIVRQQQLARIQAQHGLAIRKQLHHRLQKIHIHRRPLLRPQACAQHIRANHLPLAGSQNLIPLLQAIPHLAALKRVNFRPIKRHTRHQHQLRRKLAVLKMRTILHGRKTGPFFIKPKTINIAQMFGHNRLHILLARPGRLLPKQQLQQKNTARLFLFGQILLENLFLLRHMLTSLFALLNYTTLQCVILQLKRHFLNSKKTAIF